jgi:Uncharacterized conserved protein, contains double-stranded beta-helix domain
VLPKEGINLKIYRLKDLDDRKEGHIFNAIVSEKYISSGGLAFSKPNERSHSYDGPDGIDFHVHNDIEAFIIIQGKGFLEINKTLYSVTTGDVILVEPGEDHHLISGEEEPLVTLWCHPGDIINKNQQ